MMKYRKLAAAFGLTLALQTVCQTHAFAKAPCNGLKYAQTIIRGEAIDGFVRNHTPAAYHGIQEARAGHFARVVPVPEESVPSSGDTVPTGLKTMGHGIAASYCQVDLRYTTPGNLVNQQKKHITQALLHDQGFLAYDPQDDVLIVGKPKM